MSNEDIIRAENDAEIMRRKLAESAIKEQEKRNEKIKRLFNSLIELNPSISFFRTIDDDNIVISAPLERVKLPTGFEKIGNKVTNIKTANVEDVVEMGFIFEKTQVGPKLNHQNEELSAKRFFDELVKLNPDAKLKLSTDSNYINSSIEIEDMKLPKGFYNFNGTISNATIDGPMESLQFPVLVEEIKKVNETKKGFFDKFKVTQKEPKDTTLDKKKQKHNKEKTKVYSRVPKFITRIWNSKAVELLIKKPARFVKNTTIKVGKYIGKGIKTAYVGSKNFICKLTKKQKEEIEEQLEPEVEETEVDKTVVLEAMIEELKQKYQEEKNQHIIDLDKVYSLEDRIKELTEELEQLKAAKDTDIEKTKHHVENEEEKEIKKEEPKPVERITPEESLSGYSFDALKNIYENIEIISIEGGVAARNKITKNIYEGTNIITKYQMATLWTKVNGENAFAEENRTTFNYFISVVVNLISVTHDINDSIIMASLQDKGSQIKEELVSNMFEQYKDTAKNIIFKYCGYALKEKIAEIDKKRFVEEIEKDTAKPNMKETQKVDTRKSKVGTVSKKTKEKMSTKSKIYGFEKSIGTAYKEEFISEELYTMSAYYTNVAKSELTEETDFMINEINKYAKNLLNSLKKDIISKQAYEIGMDYCINAVENLAIKKESDIVNLLENHKIAIKNLKDYKEHKNDLVYSTSMINCITEIKRLSQLDTEIKVK